MKIKEENFRYIPENLDYSSLGQIKSLVKISYDMDVYVAIYRIINRDSYTDASVNTAVS